MVTIVTSINNTDTIRVCVLGLNEGTSVCIATILEIKPVAAPVAAAATAGVATALRYWATAVIR